MRKKESEMCKGIANIEKIRKKERERQQKYLAQKKAGKTSTSLAYKSKSMLTKAVKKVESMLPKFPRKRSKVVKQLMYMTDHDSPDSHAKEGQPPLDPSVVKMVAEFYECDDNSRMSPGKWDTVKVELNGESQTYKKQHPSITLDELYQLFADEYPEVVISRSKFAFLWPGHVLLNVQMPSRVCLCWYHESFIMLLETLSKVHPDFPNYSHEFPKSLVCTLPTEDCWNNKCSSCKDKKIFNFDLETASLLN